MYTAALIIISCYLIVVAFVFFNQRNLLYHPFENNYNKDEANFSYDEVLIPTSNERYIKGTILTGLEIYAIIKFNEYRSDVKYDNKTSAISKRNKSAWWMFFIYFYGILDAVVEAHLMPHKTVMDTPIE